MIGRRSQSWQVILADLALILFLTTLAGFVAVRQSEPDGAGPQILLAEPQALYRPHPETSLADWLAQQLPDPRLQLTIFARYAEGDRMVMWEQARLLSIAAQDSGHSTRIVLEPAVSSEVYAALAFDAASPQGPGP